MRRLGSWTGRLLAFVVVLVIALIAVYAAGAIKNNGTGSSSPSVSAPAAKGAEETNVMETVGVEPTSAIA
jgi:hypothetical protein